MPIALLCERILTPVDCIERGAVVIEDGVIEDIGPRDRVVIPANASIVDFKDHVISPGLIDIHVHGSAGCDFMEADGDSLAAIEQFMAIHGVTSYCPTTVTAPLDKTLVSLSRLGKAVAGGPERESSARAVPLGIHLEGPFLSHSKRGVHPADLLQKPSRDLFLELCDAAASQIMVLTIAPELEGALEVISEASARGITVSLGHSDAQYDKALAGISSGARHATHTFNAMRPLNHRHPGLLAAVMTDARLTADIIADGIHVDPVVVDLFVRAKGIESAVLITDGISATGMPDGVYKLGNLEVTVHDGRCEANGRLAGSVLTLDRAVRNMGKFAQLSFQHSVRMATLNPAKVLGLESRKGLLQKGADADLVVFSPKGEVVQTIIAGNLN